MTQPAAMAELWRGDLLESAHSGHAVICDANGEIRSAWGNPQAVIYPRSSCKMLQALPLVESGAAEGLSDEQLALACASHQGAPIHVDRVSAWLKDLGLSDDDLRCGPEVSRDKDLKLAMIRAHEAPCQVHNNCSGKHAGFLTLNRHLGGSAEYVDPDHPVQKAVRAAFEEVTDEPSPTFGIDGCSAPNFATTVSGLARAMAAFAAAGSGSGARDTAQARLTRAMIAHPELVAGEGRACTELMRATGGKAALKTGAEGVFVGILPEQGLGIALKITDGATRASEAAISALLVRLGVLDPEDPAVRKRMNAPVLNRAGKPVGLVKAADELLTA